MSVGPESLPITAVLRNPSKILLVPGPHIEDLILIEPFAHALKEQFPRIFLTAVVHERFSTLAEGIEQFDEVITTSLDRARKRSGEFDRLKKILNEQRYDIAMALCSESTSIAGHVVSSCGAAVRVGSSFLEQKGVSFNLLLKDKNEADSDRKRIEILFSLLGVRRKDSFTSGLLGMGRRYGNPLDFLRGRTGEKLIGFFFDQNDPLDSLERGDAAEAVRTVTTRRAEKCVAAGFGISEKDLKIIIENGVRILEDKTLVELVAVFADCSWTVTNSLGFTALLGAGGHRVVYLGEPSRLKKYPVNKIGSVTFLSRSAGPGFKNSLKRVMEEKYPGE